MEECWKIIEEFPKYEVNNFGVIQNIKTGRIMAQTQTSNGHLKISLGNRYGVFTRSVHRLVAEAFVERPGERSGALAPCNSVIALDGDVSNLSAYNLAWRPRSVAWKYGLQFKQPIPGAWHLIKVRNVETRDRYYSIVEAGVNDGVLWNDVWMSINTGRRVSPFGHTYEPWGVI